MAWSTPRTWSNGEIVNQTMLNTDVRDNMRELWHEVAYVEFTSTVTATAGTHTEASPLDIVSSGAITYEANPIIVEFYVGTASFAGNGTTDSSGISLWDGSTDLGRMFAEVSTMQTSFEGPLNLFRRLTPTAASHTYKFRIWATSISSAASGKVAAGAGGTGTLMPGYIRVLQKGS